MIYTKKGDKGKTGLYGIRKRIYKDNPIFSFIGSMDEVNSYLGIIISQSRDRKLNKTLRDIQSNLFTINAILAGAKMKLKKGKVKEMEKLIDEMEEKLPPLKNFILPSGTPTATRLMYARTLIRKAEREAVSLRKKKKIEGNIIIYLNRLSDLFFILSRYQNKRKGMKEIIWKED